jgi:GT2 family glycosyltransferase
MTSVGCVVLSQGTRPGELSKAVGSVLAQRSVDLDCVVVGNGWSPSDLPAGVRSVALPENVGIPEGRNIGAAEVTGDVLLFLDDDAELVGTDLLASVVAAFEDDPRPCVV